MLYILLILSSSFVWTLTERAHEVLMIHADSTIQEELVEQHQSEEREQQQQGNEADLVPGEAETTAL
jgi:hypothetical protein